MDGINQRQTLTNYEVRARIFFRKKYRLIGLCLGVGRFLVSLLGQISRGWKPLRKYQK